MCRRYGVDERAIFSAIEGDAPFHDYGNDTEVGRNSDVVYRLAHVHRVQDLRILFDFVLHYLGRGLVSNEKKKLSWSEKKQHDTVWSSQKE